LLERVLFLLMSQCPRFQVLREGEVER